MLLIVTFSIFANWVGLIDGVTLYHQTNDNYEKDFNHRNHRHLRSKLRQCIKRKER